jgi:hypothetical protein
MPARGKRDSWGEEGWRREQVQGQPPGHCPLLCPGRTPAGLPGSVWPLSPAWADLAACPAQACWRAINRGTGTAGPAASAFNALQLLFRQLQAAKPALNPWAHTPLLPWHCVCESLMEAWPWPAPAPSVPTPSCGAQQRRAQLSPCRSALWAGMPNFLAAPPKRVCLIIGGRKDGGACSCCPLELMVTPHGRPPSPPGSCSARLTCCCRYAPPQRPGLRGPDAACPCCHRAAHPASYCEEHRQVQR